MSDLKKLKEMKKDDIIELLNVATERAGAMEFERDKAISELKEAAEQRQGFEERINELGMNSEMAVELMLAIVSHAENAIHWDPDSDRSYTDHENIINRFMSRIEMVRRTFGVSIMAAGQPTENLDVQIRQPRP